MDILNKINDAVDVDEFKTSKADDKKVIRARLAQIHQEITQAIACANKAVVRAAELNKQADDLTALFADEVAELTKALES